MTSSISLSAAGKINLYLEIKGNRPDGYHELVTIYQSIDLCDRLDIQTLSVEEIRVRCDSPLVPGDTTNLAYKAAKLLQARYPDFGGVAIDIHKRIPVGGGLAGGSTNAAAVLVGLNQLWNLGMTLPELQELAAQLGSDVPFCVAGGTALATGRGEELSPLPDLDGLSLAIAKPRDLSISTPWAYQTFRSQGLLATSPVRDRSLSSEILAAIATQSDDTPLRLGRLLYNDLERVVLPAYPQIAGLKASLVDAPDSLGGLMSGSGATVFALTKHADAAQRLLAGIADEKIETWTVASQTFGIRVVS